MVGHETVLDGGATACVTARESPRAATTDRRRRGADPGRPAPMSVAARETFRAFAERHEVDP